MTRTLDTRDAPDAPDTLAIRDLRLHVPGTAGPSSTASTCTSRPVKPSPWWGSPAPARP